MNNGKKLKSINKVILSRDTEWTGVRWSAVSIENEQSEIFLDYGKGDGIVTKAILMNSLLL